MKQTYKSMYEKVQPPEALLSLTRMKMRQRRQQPQKALNRRRISLTAALAAGVALACAVWLPMDGRTPSLPGQTQEQPIAILTPLSAGKHTADVQLSHGELHFDSTDVSMADASLYFDDETMEEHFYNEQQMIAYLGRDFRPSYVPEDLQREDGQTWKVVAWKEDGKTVHENFSVTYQENFLDTYQPLRRQVRIEAAKGKLPTQCAVYHADGAQISNIKGTPVEVTYTELGYGPYTQDHQPAGTYTVYRAMFIYDGIGYIVHGENITQEEFIRVLCSLFV